MAIQVMDDQGTINPVRQYGIVADFAVVFLLYAAAMILVVKLMVT